MPNRRMATKRTAISRGPVGGVNDAQLHGGDLVPVLRRLSLAFRSSTTGRSNAGSPAPGLMGCRTPLSPQSDGTTDADVVIVREGKNLKGLVLGAVLGTVGKRVLRKAFDGSVEAIEARNATHKMVS